MCLMIIVTIVGYSRYKLSVNKKEEDMKKIFILTFILVMIFTTIGFAQPPQTIDDLEFMKSNWFNSSVNYTYYDLKVGENTDDSNSGSIGSLQAYKPSNIDVYTLKVLNDGIVTIDVIPTNTMYGTTTNIETISFISNNSGSKTRYSAADNNTGRNGIRIVDFNGKGSCRKIRYLTKGTYYFSVTGSQYSKANHASNDLAYVDYNVAVTMDTFTENLNSSAENPYIVSTSNEIIKGILGMELNYSESQDKFIYDTKDKIVFPSGNERNVKLTITSSGNSVLKTIDDSGKLNGFIKNSGNSMVEGTKFELGYGESVDITTTFKANEQYSMELVESFPKEYTIIYEEISSNSTSQPNSTQEEPTVIEQKPTVPTKPVVVKPSVDVTVPISIIMTDKDTGNQINVKNVIVNGKEMDIIDNSVLNQQVPDKNGNFSIVVTAEGYETQAFNKPILYDGLNYIYLTLERAESQTAYVNPIIMLHTDCEISPQIFDNREYKIYVNGEDYTSHEGYMGHITNLPNSKIGDTYQVRVEVEGYNPYEETITIPPSEYDNGNSVVFVNVNTTKVATSTPPATSPATPQTTSSVTIDTASNWAKETIEKSINAGLKTEKMMNSNFKESATREEFCELIVKMYEKLGGTANANNNPFIDTNNQEVLKAYNAGIISGTSATTFSPNSSLTREQLCVMLIRAIDASGKRYELSTPFQKEYNDMDEISSWAKGSVKILNGYKIINGNGADLDPKGIVTKEMAVIMLYKAYELFK